MFEEFDIPPGTVIGESTLDDGSVVIQIQDGGSYEISPDGYIYAVDQYGSVTVSDPYGNVVTDSTQGAVQIPTQKSSVVDSAANLANQITALANIGYKTVASIETAKRTGGAGITYSRTGQAILSNPAPASLIPGVSNTVLFGGAAIAFLALRKK
jgi:hypothetical protein